MCPRPSAIIIIITFDTYKQLSRVVRGGHVTYPGDSINHRPPRLPIHTQTGNDPPSTVGTEEEDPFQCDI